MASHSAPKEAGPPGHDAAVHRSGEDSSGNGADPAGKASVDEFQHIERLIEAEQRVGKVAQIHKPFSRQLKEEIRALFPEDKRTFDLTDKFLRHVKLLFVTLRLATFSLLAVFLLATYLLAWLYTSPGAATGVAAADWLASMPPELRLALVLVLDVAVGAALWLFRRGLREWVFRTFIDREVERFSSRFKQTYTGSLVAALTRARAVQDRASSDWTSNALQSMAAALYNAKRSEYLDRYGTTTLWNIHEFFDRIESISWAAKLLMLAGAIYALWRLGDPPSAPHIAGLSLVRAGEVLLGLLAAVVALTGWVFDRRESGALTDVFEEEFSTGQDDWPVPQEEISYMVQIPRVVENLITEILSYARSARQGH